MTGSSNTRRLSKPERQRRFIATVRSAMRQHNKRMYQAMLTETLAPNDMRLDLASQRATLLLLCTLRTALDELDDEESTT